MYSNKEHSLYPFAEQLLLNYPIYQLASNDSDVQNILEMQGMKLGSFATLKYSRRPNLLDSYRESSMDPLIIVDNEKSSLGVVCDQEVVLNSKQEKIHYTCDLRIARSASEKVRMNFKKIYLEILKSFHLPCYTVVLKENIKAIKALTNKKDNLFYNEVYRYKIRSILVLPSLLIGKNSKCDLNISKVTKTNFEEIERINNLKTFAHKIDRDKSYFKIHKGKGLKGFFGISKSENRKLFIDANSVFAKIWLKILRYFFGKKYDQEIPMVYVTNLYLHSEIVEKDTLKKIVKFLYNKKYVTNGELLVICHDENEKLECKISTAQFVNTGILFKVESKQKEYGLSKGKYLLNPAYL